MATVTHSAILYDVAIYPVKSKNVLLRVLTGLRPVLTGLRPVLTGLWPVLTGLRPVLTCHMV